MCSLRERDLKAEAPMQSVRAETMEQLSLLRSDALVFKSFERSEHVPFSFYSTVCFRELSRFLLPMNPILPITKCIREDVHN